MTIPSDEAVLDVARHVNELMRNRGEPGRIRYVSIDYVWEDDRWMATITWGLPDSFFPEEDSIKETLARWPGDKLAEYGREFDWALAEMNTSRELSTLSLFSSESELEKIGATRGRQVA